MRSLKLMPLVAALLALGLAVGCGDDGNENPTVFTFMEGAVADCEFDVVSFQIGAGAPQETSINGLAVAELTGANKIDADVFEMVTRRGVRFSAILAEAGVTQADDTPVNCVARDGFDPLRTRLDSDTTKLPTFAFLRDHGYVYVGSPGDKDPLYPEMEGKTLIVDYDMTGDADVPAYLGGTLASLGMFRWKMLEKVDATQRGVIEIDPVVP
ncbi:MAG TPA: hypothetical protein PK668_26095 [Myxococcota bacterium]|nr:hypothetical protein [Myxococcota bacterium]HRY96998.1 hypothetical protein [Myxococcota bacterium]HSA23025.1 hypothetical protein [Myxococcota bacterium]